MAKRSQQWCRNVGLAVTAIGLLVALGGCEKEKKVLQEQHQEVVNEIGGAPKRTIDDVKSRTNAAMQKGAARYEDVGTDGH